MVSGREAEGTWQVGALGSEMRASGIQSVTTLTCGQVPS